MKIAKFGFNSFGENTYVVWDNTNECIVIDAGNSNAQEDAVLADFISKNGLTPVFAVCTHAHPDHLAGIGFVMDKYNVPLALHSDDTYLLDVMPVECKKYRFSVPQTTIGLDLKHNNVKFGDTELQVIHTPGHTRGGVCLYEPNSKILFSGDTLFRESIGRSDLPGGNYDELMSSITKKLLPLGDDVVVYPGHAQDTTIGSESVYNPFITEVLNGEVNVGYDKF